MHLLQNKANKSTMKLPFTWQQQAWRDFWVNLLHILGPKQSYFPQTFFSAYGLLKRELPPPSPYPKLYRLMADSSVITFGYQQAEAAQRQWYDAEISK